MKKLLKIFKNDKNVIFRIKGSNSYITNDKLEGIYILNVSIGSECVKVSLTLSENWRNINIF